MGDRRPHLEQSPAAREAVLRWECRCQDPPVLLATYEPNGRINIKARDRYWHVLGRVWTICPRCGAEHLLDLHPEQHGTATLPGAGGPRS